MTGRGATTVTAVSITNATVSTTTATGALIVTGGVGIGGAIYAGSIQNTPIGATTASTGAFTTLSATSTVSFNMASANISLAPTGTGTVTINPATASTINNCSIGATTRGTGAFTTIDANSTVSLNPANTTVTLSPTGTGGVTISPTGSSGLTINPTTTGTINNASVGATTRSTGAFTTLDANAAVGLSPAGATVTISPSGAGTVTMAPATAGNINNMNIGGTTKGTGAFTTLTANGASTLTAGTSSTTTGTGTLVVTGGVGVSENLNVGGALTVTGNLTVNGTTTTINSTQVTVDDIILQLGGDTAPVSDDALDKGIEFRWYSGSAKIGYFGFDRSTGNMTYVPDSTNTGGVISGTKGTIDAYLDWSNVTNTPGIGTGSVTQVATGNGMNFTTFTTTGTVTMGTPSSLTGATTNAVTSTSHTHAVTTATAVSLTNASTSTAGSGPSLAMADHTHAITGFLTAESDTLSTVTGRGATTATALTFTNTTDSTSNATGTLVISGGLAVSKTLFSSGDIVSATTGGTKIRTSNANQTSLSTVSLTPVNTFLTATYRSAKYLVQITQGSNYQVSEILVIHNGATTYMTEYGVIETNGVLATFTSDVSAGSARLLVTMGSATAATINVDTTYIVI